MLKRLWMGLWAGFGCLLLLGCIWVWQPVADASILYTADSSGSVLVQSRRTLRDTERHSWQVVAFRRIQADRQVDGILLRLVGFPGEADIAHPQPLALVDQHGQVYSAADVSSQIALEQPTQVGQYDLQSVLLRLPLERLRLKIATATTPVEIPVSSALLEEWQQVSNIRYDDLLNACERFPQEARQNPNFPAWLGCGKADAS